MTSANRGNGLASCNLRRTAQLFFALCSKAIVLVTVSTRAESGESYVVNRRIVMTCTAPSAKRFEATAHLRYEKSRWYKTPIPNTCIALLSMAAPQRTLAAHTHVIESTRRANFG